MRRDLTTIDDEIDFVILRLAAAPLGVVRRDEYEESAKMYGDERLYRVADKLRERGFVGWGSRWTHCWLTQMGEYALDSQKTKATK